MKLAIFDLDGTLYLKNSHLEILNNFYKTEFYTSKIFKIFYRIFPHKIQNYLIDKYNKIPKDKKENYILPFRRSAIELLSRKKEDGFKIIIISNAPYELVKSAANYLKVDFKHSEIGKKHKLISRDTISDLFVCTDNITDIELIKLADEGYIYVRNNEKKFKKNLKNKRIKYIREE